MVSACRYDLFSHPTLHFGMECQKMQESRDRARRSIMPSEKKGAADHRKEFRQCLVCYYGRTYFICPRISTSGSLSSSFACILARTSLADQRTSQVEVYIKRTQYAHNILSLPDLLQRCLITISQGLLLLPIDVFRRQIHDIDDPSQRLD